MPALVITLSCLVIGVADGDTLRARCATQDGAVNLSVRVAEIDAPEKRQPWGQRSRQHLAALCLGKPARVMQQATDRYGRAVARVSCDGIDASAEQVRAGMAWVFDRYVSDRTLYGVQDEARAAQRGLWRDPQPLAPWQWRRARPAVEETDRTG